MKLLVILCFLPLACFSCPEIISRMQWRAKPPKSVQCLATRASNVIIHHTYVPKICTTTSKCKSDMKDMQTAHQNVLKLTDIGYNFCIGGEGNVYEGRGWGAVGFSMNGFEFNSTNICFIGDYMRALPTEAMLQSAINLIECGINLGYINERFNVRGVREVRHDTLSPGDMLQDYITKTHLGYPRIK